MRRGLLATLQRLGLRPERLEQMAELLLGETGQGRVAERDEAVDLLLEGGNGVLLLGACTGWPSSNASRQPIGSAERSVSPPARWGGSGPR